VEEAGSVVLEGVPPWVFCYGTPAPHGGTVGRTTMKLGACVRRLGFSVWDRLHGAPVHHHLEKLEQAQTVSPEELELWQRERLHALLCHARDTTDFYRQLIPQDLSPEESFNVVHALPLMTKAQIKADPEAFMSGAFPCTRLHRGTTSGSTGTPLVFWMDRFRRARVRAEILYFGRWAGYEIGMRHCYLRYLFGRPKGFLQRWLENQLIIDTTSVDEAKLEKIRTLLTRSRTQVLISHPSVLSLLAQHCLRRGIPFRDFSMRAVISVGAPLLPETRASIEEAFGCPVFDRYSAWEFGVIASECERQQLHLNAGSLYIEFLPHEGHRPTAAGEPTRFVVTDLFNYGMPFIRYEIEDVVVLDRNLVPTVVSLPSSRRSTAVWSIRSRPQTAHGWTRWASKPCCEISMRSDSFSSSNSLRVAI